MQLELNIVTYYNICVQEYIGNGFVEDNYRPLYNVYHKD